MNVFEAICLNNIDPVERDFIAVETAFDIAVLRAEKEYSLSMGLISSSGDTLFTEAADAKKSTASKSFIQTILEAITNFFNGIIDTISSIFSGKKESDLRTDKDGKIHLNTDIEKMDQVVDREIDKGNSLLHKMASAVGVSDAEVNEFISNSTKEVKKVAGGAITAVAALGFNKLIKSFTKKKTDKLDNSRDLANKVVEVKPENEGKVKKILSHMSVLAKNFGHAAKAAGIDIKGRFQDAVNQAETDYKVQHDDVKKTFDEVDTEYNDGKLDDDAYRAELKALDEADRVLLHNLKLKKGEAALTQEQDASIGRFYTKAMSALKTQKKKKKISQETYNGYVKLLGSIINQYKDGKMEYIKAVGRIKDLAKN